MFKLLQSIFQTQSGAASEWPETLVQAVIERAVDGTDPRLRALGGYRRQLREPALRTIDYVMRLVDELPAPVPANAASYRDDACLRSMFASHERMLEVLARDRNLDAALREGLNHGQPVTALLAMQMTEKHTLGIDMEEDMLKRDVQQTVVSFDAHRLLDPCADEAETRRALKRRAFDHILAQVLDAMAQRRSARSKLAAQRELMQRKRTALDRAGWSFGSDKGDAPREDAATLERELAGIEAELTALGTDAVTLETHLKMLADALADPASRLWNQERKLILDHRNVLRAKPDSVARELCLRELHDARGATIVTLLLQIDPGLLPRVDFFQAASRYTG